jgi:hypothetical protein
MLDVFSTHDRQRIDTAIQEPDGRLVLTLAGTGGATIRFHPR